MGIVSWLAAGAIAALIVSLLPWKRRWFDALLALVAAPLAGFAATALDFGGLKVIDPRAIACAFLLPMAIIPLLRILRFRRVHSS